MHSSGVLFSHKLEDYWTPKDFFNNVSLVYGPFVLDVSASAENTKCDNFYTKEDDGLAKDWYGKVWCNPPYGREITRWLAKAIREMLIGNTERTVFLIPARTDTKWFHSWVWLYASEILFVEGRLTFENSQYNAPFPSMLVIFDKCTGNPPEIGVWTK